MYIEDLILLSGGFLISSDQENLTINRPELDVKSERIVRKYSITVDKDYLLGLKDKPDNDFILKDRDIVVVKQILGYQESIRVSISGEVNFPQSVVTEFKNTSLANIIDYAGGLTRYANLEASSLIRDGKVITLDFEDLDSNEIFVNGDVINIASNNGIVSTTGAVKNESNFIWEKGLKARNYIRNSGGKGERAGKSYMILPNGNTKKIGWFKNPRVLPNSIIITDFRPIEEKRLDRFKIFVEEISGTMMFITTTLTSILLATKL